MPAKQEDGSFLFIPRSGNSLNVITDLEQRRQIEPGQYIRFRKVPEGILSDPDAARPWDVVSSTGVPLKRHEVPFHEQPRGRLAKSARNVPEKYR